MKSRLLRFTSGVIGMIATTATAAVCLLGVAFAGVEQGQNIPAGQAERPKMAEEVFKDIQLLKGIPVKEFMETMGFFAAATGMNCTQCHGEESGGNWARYADDNRLKQTARRMIVMMNGINQSYFGGRRVLTCYSCHRGLSRPLLIPDLAEQYGSPLLREPDEILQQAAGAPSADKILDKYIQALGGAERLAKVTSFVAKGTSKGYDDPETYPVEIYAKAPGQRATVVHGADGDSAGIYDGRYGYAVAPEAATPVPVLPLTGDDLAAAKVEAELSFPARIKLSLSEWRVGFPVTIDDRESQVVQGKPGPGGRPVKLYFDMESGVLVRLVSYTDTPVGAIPTQIDYADYRDISGIKMPFKWTTTWTSGRSVTELSEIQLNVPIDASRFAKPVPPTPPTPSTR
jgi:photosynthetic reaction center cytochrome c subunit